MDYYMVQVDQMVIDLKEHAALVCAESKKSNSIFWEKDAENNYWYYQAINEIKDKYSNFPASDFGIYYYEEDCVITAAGNLSSDGYFRKLEMQNQKQEENLKDFFAEEKYEEFMLCVGGTKAQGAGKNFNDILLTPHISRQKAAPQHSIQSWLHCHLLLLLFL